MQHAKVFRRETPGEIMEKEKCPLRCEEKLRDVFASLGYDDIPTNVKVASTSSTKDTGYPDHNPEIWCSESTYLASLYLCLQQHCTPPIAQTGWADAGKACEGGIPTEYVIRQDMQLKVVEIGDIETPEGTIVDWIWTRLWGGLTHNQQALKQETDFNMASFRSSKFLKWCIYGIAGTVLMLAAIHHGIQRYRAKNIDFKASTRLEALSTISRRTKTTAVISKGTAAWTWIRKHFILPALFGERHLEPIGWVTLPTRIQALAVMAFIGVNTIFLVIDNRNRQVVNRATQPGDMTRYLGDRAGFLALANLPIIFLLGGRNNFLIGLTGLSYGVFNVFHKWVARVATALAIIHSISYAVYMYQIGGAELHGKQKNDSYWWNGVAATIVMSMIIVLAILPFRRRMYELFLFLHIVGGILFLYFCFRHLRLSSTGAYNPWLWACIACWSFDRLARFWRIIQCNTRRGRLVKHNAKIKVIKETNIMKISIYPNKDGVGFFPGAHYFLYFGASWKFWQSHPFTAVDWRPKKALVNVNEKARHVRKQERERRLATATSINDPARLGTAVSERLGTSASNGIGVYSPTSTRPHPLAAPDIVADDSDDEWDRGAVVDDDGAAGPTAEWATGRAKITFLVRPHKGITQTVWNRIADLSEKNLGKDGFGNRIIDPGDVRNLSLSIPCLIEGPYGHEHSLYTYDTVLVIAGGIGVSTTLAYLYNHMARVEKGETFTRRFVFVWSCREDMLMERLIWDADLINKTQDTSNLYGTQIEMMLYFTGTATKKPDVKFVEPLVKEILDEKSRRREWDGDFSRRPSTGRPSTGRPSTGRPSTGKQESSSKKSLASPPLAYHSSSPEKYSTNPKRSAPSRSPPGKIVRPSTSENKRSVTQAFPENTEGPGRSHRKGSASKRPAPEGAEKAPTVPLTRSQSKRSPPEISDSEPKEKDRSRSNRGGDVERDRPILQSGLALEESQPKPVRRESTRSNREKRRQERDHNLAQERPTEPEAAPPKPVRRPSTRSNHEKTKDRDCDREKDLTHSTRPPLPLTIGRPNIMEIIENENRRLTGKMAVLVCGPDKMVDGTREAVVKYVGKDAAEGARIQYFEEAFGW
ncbi:ferric reductase like transmembrane component-domain-containing protein [Terfezia claveryi]|nr:ferric reductase like transmembrane component-domain-containing protein [Terfezia claveryi]